MSKTKAYTHFIGTKGTGKSEDFKVNESSPAWVLTFVRWNVRDTLRAPQTGLSPDLLAVRTPLIVESDCVQLTVNSNKAALTPSMSAVLVETDVNYATAIAPGDFVFVNMLNWESEARRVAIRAHQPIGVNSINGINDGFKGLFKIQSVRKTVSTDPQSGVKRVLIKIDGYAFTEFNNMIYYNPYIARDNQGTDKDNLLFISNIHGDYKSFIEGGNACQILIKFLIQSFIGVGVDDRGETQTPNGAIITANTHFYVPQQVGSFLGNPNAKSAKDVYNYLFGIQKYSTAPNQSLSLGMNPENLTTTSPSDRFYSTAIPCSGQCFIKAEYWNQTNAWSIINQYTNSPLNELYTCFRVSPDGNVMPTVVFRQIPFTTDYFNNTTGTSDNPVTVDADVTYFSSVPRWKIATALIFNSDIGRDEAARINFVQYYVQPPANIGKVDGYIASQTQSLNFVYDVNDVQRSGLRPNVISNNFEDLTVYKQEYVARTWANIIGDALIGGHLKMNGTIECVGIKDPICVGDNLEFNDVVYHIEEVTHTCGIDPYSGMKSFRTNIRLSNGISVSETKTGIEYAEMQYTNAYHDRQNDYNNDKILPGVSEEQDELSRYKNGIVTPSKTDVNRRDKPFAQPGQVIKPLKPSGKNE